MQVRAPELLPQTYPVVELTLEEKKCGFGLVNQIKRNYVNFTFEQQNILKILLSRPFLQKSIVSPSGFFRIHFDTTGFNIPSYVSGWSIDQNVAEVAIAADSVYRFEIQFLGYLSPPQDNGAGGDNKYDIYIVNQNNSIYGYTEWESPVGSVNWTAFSVIDNDYNGYYSFGLKGMKVTVAHEFHHGIQVGNYAVENSSSPIRDSDTFFYEITSTSMEEFVYDDVNDYYAYMHTYFSRTYNAFPNQNGYNLAIWNIYLKEKFDFGILKRQWELIPTRAALLALNQSLLEKNTSFPKELNRFGIWTFFTGFRSIPGQYFEEAVNYPLISPKFTILFPSPPSNNMGAAPTSNNFVLFNIPTSSDSLFAIITNGDAFAASENPNQLFDFDYVLFADTISGTRKLGHNYSSNFLTSDPFYWSVSEILDNILVREDTSSKNIINVVDPFAFPNPYYYSSSGYNIFIALDMALNESVDFNVYSTDLHLLYSSTLEITQTERKGKIYIGLNWDGKDDNGNRLASGVYIYVIKRGDKVVKGKVVIFNE